MFSTIHESILIFFHVWNKLLSSNSLTCHNYLFHTVPELLSNPQSHINAFKVFMYCEYAYYLGFEPTTIALVVFLYDAFVMTK